MNPVLLPSWFDDTADLPVVKARVRPAASWIVESYPCRSIKEEADGSFLIEIVSNSEHWSRPIGITCGSQS